MSATEQDIRARLLTTLERLKSMSSIEDLKDFHSDWNMLNEDYENAQVSGELAEETEEIAFSVASCVETICMGLASLSVAVTDEDTVEDHLLFPGSSERTLSPRSALLPKVEDDSEVSLWSTKSLPSTQLALEGHEPSSPSIFMWTENYGSPSVAAQPLTSMLDPRTSYPSPAPSTSPSSSPEPEIFAHSAPQQFMERLDMPNASQGVSSWSLPSPPSSERSASPESARSCSPAPRRRIQKRQLPIPSPSSSERALSSSPSSIYKSTPTTASHTLQSQLNSKPFAYTAALWLLDNLHRPYPSDRTRQSILIFCGSVDPSPELAASSEISVPTPLAAHRRDLDAWFTYARKRIGWSRSLNRKHLTQFFVRHDSNGLDEEDREKFIEIRRRAEDLVREVGGPEVDIPTWTPPASVKSRNENVVPAQTASKRTRSDDEDDEEMEEATNKRIRYIAYEKSTDEPEWLAPSTPTQAKEEDQIVVLTFNNDSSPSHIPAGKDEPSTNGLGLTMESSTLSVHKRRRSTEEPIDGGASPMDRSKRRRVVSDSDTSFGTPSSLPHSKQMLRSVSAPAPPPPPGPSFSSASCKRKQEPRTISLSGDPNIWAHFDLNEKPERPEQGVNKMGSFSRVQSRQAMRRSAVPRFGETTGPGLRKHCEHAPGRMFPPPAPAAFFSQSSSLQMFPPPQPQAIALSLPGEFEVVEKAYGEEGSLDYIPSLDGFGTELCFR